MVMDVFENWISNSNSVESRSASSEFIQNGNWMFGAIFENVESLFHFYKEGGFAFLKHVWGSNTSENSVYWTEFCKRGWHITSYYKLDLPIWARIAAMHTILKVVLFPPMLGPVRNTMFFSYILTSFGIKFSFRQGCRSFFIYSFTSPVVIKLGRHIECMFMKLVTLKLHKQSISPRIPFLFIFLLIYLSQI